jgi:hypothetical protein
MEPACAAVLAFVEIEPQRVLRVRQLGEKILDAVNRGVIQRDFDRMIRPQEMQPGFGGALPECAFERESVERQLWGIGFRAFPRVGLVIDNRDLVIFFEPKVDGPADEGSVDVYDELPFALRPAGRGGAFAQIAFEARISWTNVPNSDAVRSSDSSFFSSALAMSSESNVA